MPDECSVVGLDESDWHARESKRFELVMIILWSLLLPICHVLIHLMQFMKTANMNAILLFAAKCILHPNHYSRQIFLFGIIFVVGVLKNYWYWYTL